MSNIEKLIKKHLPMTETAFYILLSLNTPRHGYGITKDGLIDVYDDSDKKIIYEITDTGREILKAEINRIKLVYSNIISQEEMLK